MAKIDQLLESFDQKRDKSDRLREKQRHRIHKFFVKLDFFLFLMIICSPVLTVLEF